MARKRLEIVVDGMFPLLCDRMDDATLTGLITGARPQIDKEEKFEVKAQRKLYRENDDEKGKIGLPSSMLYACLVKVGAMVPYQGKKMISTGKDTLLPGLLRIEEEFLPFPIPEGKKEVPWVVDKRRGRLPNGTAVGLIRPKLPDWGFTVHVVYNDKILSQSTIEKLFTMAGSFKGLGSFRPACKGPFGTFSAKFTDVTPPEWATEKDNSVDEIEETAMEDIEDLNEKSDDELAAEAAGTNGDGEKPRKSRVATTVS